MQRLAQYIDFFLIVVICPGFLHWLGLPFAIRRLDALEPVEWVQEDFDYGGPIQEHSWIGQGYLKRSIGQTELSRLGWTFCGHPDETAADIGGFFEEGRNEGLRLFLQQHPRENERELSIYRIDTDTRKIQAIKPCLILIHRRTGWVYVSLCGKWSAWAW